MRIESVRVLFIVTSRLALPRRNSSHLLVKTTEGPPIAFCCSCFSWPRQNPVLFIYSSYPNNKLHYLWTIKDWPSLYEPTWFPIRNVFCLNRYISQLWAWLNCSSMSRRAIDMNRMPAIVNPFTVFNVQTQHWPSRYSIMTVALCWSTSSHSTTYSLNFKPQTKEKVTLEQIAQTPAVCAVMTTCSVLLKLPDSQWYTWNSYEGGHCVHLASFFFPLSNHYFPPSWPPDTSSSCT